MAIRHLFVVANGRLSEDNLLTEIGANQIRFATSSIQGTLGKYNVRGIPMELICSDEPCAVTAAEIICDHFSITEHFQKMTKWPWTQSGESDLVFFQIYGRIQLRLLSAKILVTVLPPFWANKLTQKICRDAGLEQEFRSQELQNGDVLGVKYTDQVPITVEIVSAPIPEN